MNEINNILWNLEYSMCDECKNELHYNYINVLLDLDLAIRKHAYHVIWQISII